MNAIELKQAMAKLPEPKTDLKPPFWEYWRWELWQRVVRGDDPAGFMAWPCVHHTMLVDHWIDAIHYEGHQLISDHKELGNATGKSILSNRDSDKVSLNRNAIHQLYHIHQWEKATGKKIADLSSIVEFGGGYGAMALVCRRLGFTGKYYIYDLSEFALLQQWFLSQNGVEGVIWNWWSGSEADLLIGLYSLSEVDFGVRDKFLAKLRNPQSYLFLYSGQWEQYDNVKYFQQDITPLAKNWSHQELTHLPDRHNYYSIGW